MTFPKLKNTEGCLSLRFLQTPARFAEAPSEAEEEVEGVDLPRTQAQASVH